MANNGVSGALQASKPILMTIAGFTAVAWYNVVELDIMIWLRFKRHRGLYFWSLLIASWGVAAHALGMIARFFVIFQPEVIGTAFAVVGWWCMVTGQSMVLYSRLHLIMRDNRKVRWVLYMIIFNGIVLHGTASVLVFMAQTNLAYRIVYAYSIFEKFQVTVFAVQETTISSLYLWYTWKMIKPGAVFPKANYRSILVHLIRVNIFIIILDLTLLGSEFANHYEIQTSYKSACYSIKLKLEFVILNQLVALTRSNVNSINNPSSGFSRGRSIPPGEPRSPVVRGTLWPNSGPHGIEPPCKTYRVSACTSSPSSRRKVRHDEEILRTIDVDVTISESVPESRASTARGSMSGGSPGDCDEKSKEAKVVVESLSSSSSSPLGSPAMLESQGMEFLTGNSYLAPNEEARTPTGLN